MNSNRDIPELVGQVRRPLAERADAVSAAAELGWTIGDLENIVDSFQAMLADERLSDGVRLQALEGIFRIGSRLITEEMQVQRRVDDSSIVARRPTWSGWAGRLQRCFRASDAAFGRITLRMSASAHPRFASVWTKIGLALTGVACLLMVFGAWWSAFALLLMRVIGSMFAGGPSIARTTDHGTIDTCPTLARSLVACLAGHLTDTAAALAAGLALVIGGQPVWGFLLASAAAVAMFATMARVAAERSGVRITRSPIERFARNGTLLASVAWTAIVGIDGFPPLVFFGVGLASYGALEVVRIGAALYFEPSPREAMTFALDSAGRVTLWALRTGPSSGARWTRGHTAA